MPLARVVGMSRLPAPPGSTPAGRPPANEWGVYDPTVAGLEALLSRIEAESLTARADPAPAREPVRPTATRTTRRPRRDTAGVGRAIAEAIARAERQREQQLAPGAAPERMARGESRVEALRSTAAPPAMWLRAAAPTPTDPAPPRDRGILDTLRLPRAVAEVEYARGCRIGSVRAAGDPATPCEGPGRGPLPARRRP